MVCEVAEAPGRMDGGYVADQERGRSLNREARGRRARSVDEPYERRGEDVVTRLSVRERAAQLNEVHRQSVAHSLPDSQQPSRAGSQRPSRAVSPNSQRARCQSGSERRGEQGVMCPPPQQPSGGATTTTADAADAAARVDARRIRRSSPSTAPSRSPPFRRGAASAATAPDALNPSTQPDAPPHAANAADGLPDSPTGATQVLGADGNPLPGGRMGELRARSERQFVPRPSEGEV